MKPREEPRPPLTAAAPPHPERESPRDPFAALDDLMAVVEALCPEWPKRRTFADATGFVL